MGWGAPRGVKGKALPRRSGETPTRRIRSLGGSDEEAQGRAEWALARLRFGSTFVAKQRWKRRKDKLFFLRISSLLFSVEDLLQKLKDLASAIATGKDSL